MIGGGSGRDAAVRTAVVGALVLAAVAFVYGAGLIDVVTGYDSFRLTSLSQGLEDATPLLLLAAVLVSGPALGERHRWILAGATLVALGAAASQILFGWFLGPNGPFRSATSGEVILSWFNPLNLAAHAVSTIGWVALTWGVAAPLFPVRRGKARWIAIAMVALATGVSAWTLTAFDFTQITADRELAMAAVGLAAIVAMAKGIAAMAALANARPGPPLDWRWPVGIGLGIGQAADAAYEWGLVASSDGYLRWWSAPTYTLVVVGGLVAVAGFGIAAAVRWPAPTGNGNEELPAIGS